MWNSLATDQVPLRLAVRPLSALSDWSPANSRVVNEDSLEGNAHCIQLQMDKGDHSERCWVDPKRDYSVVRWERRDTDMATLDVVIAPQQGPDGEWLPAQWSWQLPGACGGALASFVVTVTRRAVNQKLPDGTFAADFPPGTRVHDARVDLPIVESDDSSALLPPDEARATLKAIADAWLQRQARVKRFKYTWRDGRRNTINTVCVDGEKFMKEFKKPDGEPMPSTPPERPGPDGRRARPIYKMKTVFDGVETRSLGYADDPRWPNGVLSIAAGSKRLSAGGSDASYLMLAFRPFDSKFEGIDVADLRDPAKFQVRKQKGHIGNVACVVIETQEGGGTQMSYWLDPARDYIPLRLHRMRHGEDRERVEITYQADPTCGWAPTGWTNTNVRQGGSMHNLKTDTIIEFAVNQPIQASDFQIHAPANVFVQDWRIDRRTARQKAREAALNAQDAKRKAARAAKDAREKLHPRPEAKPVYDPFADAAADVETALKLARETNKRVLVQFGANWCPSCRELGKVLKENAEVSEAVKKDFVLVFVDSETEHGRQLHEKYVPKKQRNSIPHLAVLDPTGKVLKNDDTRALEVDDDYSVPKLKAFLAEWSPRK